MNVKNGLSSFPFSRIILCNSIRYLNKPKNNCQHNLLLRTLENSKSTKPCLNISKKVNYSTEPEEKKIPESPKLPPLMNVPRIIWPSIPKAIKNTILSYFIIKPYMDNEFDMSDLVMGSKKAVEVVSKKLSSGADLGELVADDIIPVLQSRVSVMSVAQKEWLAINEEDIYFSFPYQIGIIFNEEDNNQKRFVEVMMVHHSLKGLGEMKSKGEEVPLNIGFLPEYRSKICIANYRFIKEFTKGVKDDWTINLLNHFKPSDNVMEE